ncbi:MAG: sporulation protein YunB [Defluviitaleaceae bacterium]|nr:sporulation protein YunB [Defluviitaleaceae bacterium]
MRKILLILKRWVRRLGGNSTPRASVKVRKRPLMRNGNFLRKFIFLVIIILLFAGFARSFYRFDRQILPLVLKEAELHIQTEINNVINYVVHEIIVANNITAEDFILQTQSDNTLSVNTVLANEICNAVAQAVSARLGNLEPEVVSVPMGMALGLDTLAQTGPRFTFTLAPVGNALVNYETSFTAAGINQVHFSVWLTVDSVVRIINPVQSSEIHVTRQVSLVDAIISGVVPETYVHLDAFGVNLN